MLARTETDGKYLLLTLCILQCVAKTASWLVKSKRKRLKELLFNSNYYPLKEVMHFEYLWDSVTFLVFSSFLFQKQKLSYFQFIFWFFCNVQSANENILWDFIGFFCSKRLCTKRFILSHLQTISIQKMHQTFKISNDFVFVFYNESILSLIKSVVSSRQSAVDGNVHGILCIFRDQSRC